MCLRAGCRGVVQGTVVEGNALVWNSAGTIGDTMSSSPQGKSRGYHDYQSAANVMNKLRIQVEGTQSPVPGTMQELWVAGGGVVTYSKGK